MSHEVIPSEQREHLDATLSAGLLVSTWTRELVLVQDRETGLWGIIAGRK